MAAACGDELVSETATSIDIDDPCDPSTLESLDFSLEDEEDQPPGPWMRELTPLAEGAVGVVDRAPVILSSVDGLRPVVGDFDCGSMLPRNDGSVTCFDSHDSTTEESVSLARWDVLPSGIAFERPPFEFDGVRSLSVASAVTDQAGNIYFGGRGSPVGDQDIYRFMEKLDAD